MTSSEDSLHEQRVDLSQYSTGGYDPGPTWKRGLWILISGMFFEVFFPWPSAMKAAILRAFGASVGDDVVIKPQVKIKYPWFLEIGDYSWIGEWAWIDNVAAVTLLDNVVISQGAHLLTGNHDYKSSRFELIAQPIRVETSGWVAARAVVGPGVTIGELAVLTAGSVAGKDLAARGIYRGNPAVLLRERVLES